MLHWRDFEPGVFGGFSRRDNAREFDAMIGRLLYGVGWCEPIHCPSAVFVGACSAQSECGVAHFGCMLRDLSVLEGLEARKQ